MYTILILIGVAFITVITLNLILDFETSIETLIIRTLGVGTICLLLNANTFGFTGKAPKGAIPEKYVNQTYYIEHKQLYVQKNDTIKKFGGDISSKIEYSAKLKEPSIKFKTVKIKGDPDNWIPFKYKDAYKTYISKVILPKSDLTGELTKLTVLK